MKQTATSWIWVALVALVIILILLFVKGKKRVAEVVNDDTPGVVTVLSEDQRAPISGVEVLMQESFPVEAMVVARGEFPDGCHAAGPEMVNRVGNMFTVQIPKIIEDGACTQAITPFEKQFSLNILGLPAGVYTVDVNGFATSFELLVDNVLDFTGDKG